MSNFWSGENRGESAITAWDKLIMGGVTWPGVCKIDPVTELEIDVAKQKKKGEEVGKDATLTDKGYKPATVKATIQIWDREDWEELEKILPKFAPKKTSTVRDAFDIYHPSAALLGIDTVVVQSVSIHHPEEQTLIVEMQLLQYFPETAIEKKKVVANAGNSRRGGESLEAANPNPGRNI